MNNPHMELPLSDREAAQARRWAVPELAIPTTAKQGPRTIGQLDAIEAAAREEGFSQGYKDGYTAGLREAKPAVERVRGLLDNLSQPLEQMDVTVERQLVTLTLQLARLLAQHELQVRPEAVARLVHEAIKSIQPPPRDVRVQVHPDDLPALQRLLQESPPQGAWQLVSNPSLSRGDCRVLADASTVHAELDPRVAELALALLGESS